MDTVCLTFTSDVLSYAHQLLFYVTLPCKHSSTFARLVEYECYRSAASDTE